MKSDFIGPDRATFLEKLFAGFPDAIIIANRTGNIVIVNEQTVQMFGYDKSELIGQRVEMLLPERYHTAHVGHRAGYMEQPRQRSMGAGLELFGRRKNGREFPVDISLSSLETNDGLFVMSAIRDITERKRSEQKFRALLDSAPDAIVIVDQKGAITLLNAQAQFLFGYSPDELLGRKIEVLVPQKFRDNHTGQRIEYFANPRKRPVNAGFELFGLRKDGSEFPAEISLSPLETEDQIFVISAIRDVSDRKRVEHALQKANAELEAFAYSVSHDLRAPLRTVDGFSQAILEDYGDNLPVEGAKYLFSIRAGAQQMGRLIDDLLEFSRLGRHPISKRQIDVNKLVSEVIESLTDFARDRAIKFDIADLPTCSGDHALIRQVWQNLISNALKYSRGRTPAIIEIGANVDANTVTYYIRDNGTGFNMKYYDKLFG
ncbi:MAG: PAS domain S-box protein, partial [Candidatus Zixiibacteriota bacterium]